MQRKKLANTLQSAVSTALRNMMFLSADFLCVAFAFQLALLFRFGTIPGQYVRILPGFVVLGFVLTAGLMLVLKSYTVDMVHFNLLDALKMGLCLVLGYLMLLYFNQTAAARLPLGVLFNFCCIHTLLLGSYRLLLRAWHWFHGKYILDLKQEAAKNILIFGAGDAGQYLLNMLMYNPKEKCRVVGFIDDNDSLWGMRIKGVKVLGGRELIPKVSMRHHISEIIIAIPFVDNSTIREIFGYCANANLTVRRFANLTSFTERSLSKATIDDVKIEDLLGRSEIKLDMVAVKELIWGKTVLVTGGAGSIGSEICRQALRYGAKMIVIFDFNENGLFEIGGELAEQYSKTRFCTVLGSIRDEKRLREVFHTYSPDIVFHTAAHKHVPMMELNPYEALTNNVIGTYNVANAAKECGASRFILISTDKAVNPTNIMGASKRIAELLIQYMNLGSSTIFSAVRFGNVLGSNGSVIPIFRRQISAGGPVTVTDRDMKRFFMTIPEAVQLVLESSAMAKGAEIFVLNMGEPVSIYELACTMIRLSGLVPDKDIKIKITGLRDGEKLYEEISMDSEKIRKTENDRVFILNSEHFSPELVQSEISRLFSVIYGRKHEELYDTIRIFVPSFFDSRFSLSHFR